MVTTEREYVRSLCYIIDSYFPEMERLDLPQDLRGKRSVIFGNLEKLYDFHSQYFLRELESCCNHPLRVSHCFLRHVRHRHLLLGAGSSVLGSCALYLAACHRAAGLWLFLGGEKHPALALGACVGSLCSPWRGWGGGVEAVVRARGLLVRGACAEPRQQRLLFAFPVVLCHHETLLGQQKAAP